MKTIRIEIPDHNDSFSRITLLGKVYYLRFSWNETEQRWYFGLYNDQQAPIFQGMNIVPGYPLNLITGIEDAPMGIFHASCDASYIGRKDFMDGKAEFFFTYNEVAA